MAIKKKLNEMSMLLNYKVGVNDKGKDIIKSQKFSKIKLDTKDEDFYAVGKALSKVLAYSGNVEREESYIFIEE